MIIKGDVNTLSQSYNNIFQFYSQKINVIAARSLTAYFLGLSKFIFHPIISLSKTLMAAPYPSISSKRRYDSNCHENVKCSVHQLSEYLRRRLHLFVILLKQCVYTCKCFEKKTIRKNADAMANREMCSLLILFLLSVKLLLQKGGKDQKRCTCS